MSENLPTLLVIGTLNGKDQYSALKIYEVFNDLLSS